jgi:5-methylcytosine-specific restriction endonuclease McrA
MPAKDAKQAVADEIAAFLRIPRDELGPGSKEHLAFLQDIADALGLSPIGSKLEVAQRVVEHLGGTWTRDCYSTGDTVQTTALLIMRDAIRNRLGEVRAERLISAAGATSKVRKGDPPPEGQRTPARLPGGESDFVRCQRVVAWVLVHADGKCEYCQCPAPFRDACGLPFLEVHHVRPLAEGGSDTVDNAVALCPNCHRAAHHAKDRRDRRNQLRDRLRLRGYGSPKAG